MSANQPSNFLAESKDTQSISARGDTSAICDRPIYRFSKSMLDFLCSLVLLVAASPIFLLIAILIKIDSKGPVFFVTSAMGQGGRGFPLYKFRTMHPVEDAEADTRDVIRNSLEQKPTVVLNGVPVYKTAFASANRITRVGRYLRKASLDELPQLLNILRGEMSFVGPRPSLPREAALYTEWQKRRFLVKPGLTGLYQVSARNRVPVDEMIRIDLDYIHHRSFSLDLVILSRTPRAMFSGL